MLQLLGHEHKATLTIPLGIVSTDRMLDNPDKVYYGFRFLVPLVAKQFSAVREF